MGLLYRTRRRGVFGDREVGFAREPARARELSEWIYFYFVNRGYLRALRCAKVGRYRIRNLRVYTRSNLICVLHRCELRTPPLLYYGCTRTVCYVPNGGVLTVDVSRIRARHAICDQAPLGTS